MENFHLNLNFDQVDIHPALAYDPSNLLGATKLAEHGRLKSTDFAPIEEQDLTREEVKSMLIKAIEREREAIFDSGKKEGIDIGKKKGIEERNRQIAHTMVANGFTLPTIAQVLALSEDEVEDLLTDRPADDTTTPSRVD